MWNSPRPRFALADRVMTDRQTDTAVVPAVQLYSYGQYQAHGPKAETRKSLESVRTESTEGSGSDVSPLQQSSASNNLRARTDQIRQISTSKLIVVSYIVYAIAVGSAAGLRRGTAAESAAESTQAATPVDQHATERKVFYITIHVDTESVGSKHFEPGQARPGV
jgi:hypothetical protein